MRRLEDGDSVYVVTAVSKIPVVARDYEEAMRIAEEFRDDYSSDLSVSGPHEHVWDEEIRTQHPKTRMGCASTSVRALLFERRERKSREEASEEVKA